MFDHQQAQTKAQPGEKLLTVPEVALRLGVSCRTIRNWMRLPHPLPHMRLGCRAVRFDWHQVLAWAVKQTPQVWTTKAEVLATEILKSFERESSRS